MPGVCPGGGDVEVSTSSVHNAKERYPPKKAG